MKQIVKIATVCSLVATLGLAYTVDGELDLQYKGFKTDKKIGVSGTFKDVKLNSKDDVDFAEFAKSLSVKIDGNKVDTQNLMRDKNVAILFSKEASITAKIVGVDGDEKQGIFSVDITMGGITQNTNFDYTSDGKIIDAKGKIDILDFGMQETFDAFAKKCSAFHAKKTWSDVEISFKLPIKD